MKPDHSQKFLQRRRFVTVLPLIVVPFATIVFWLLGGGSGVSLATVAPKGLNMLLPDAKIAGSSLQDKMSFYAMADKDSVKRDELVKMDPNLNDASFERFNVKTTGIKKDVEEIPYYPVARHKQIANKPYEEVEQLQGMLQTVQNRPPDPEIEALNGALDKLLSIQQPQHGGSAARPYNKKLYAVNSFVTSEDQSYFGKPDTATAAGFYSESFIREDTSALRVIPAMVQGTQTLQQGSVIKLRILKDMYVGAERIATGSFLFGTASMDNERLRIVVEGIASNGRIYPVELIAYDADGIEGIYIPGSASRDIVKQSADQSVQSLGIVSLDPSIKAQASAAAVGAAKSLLSKKVRQVRVSVKSGYKIFLQDAGNKK